MALRTKFIASPNVTPGVLNVRASPGEFSRVAQAEGEAAGRTGAAFQQAAGQIGEAFIQAQDEARGFEDVVDPLYIAQSKADMQIRFNDSLKQLGSTATAGGDYPDQTITAFDGLARDFVDNAPNIKTRDKLMTSFAALRGSSFQHAQKFQTALNYQADMQSFREGTNALMSLGLADPRDQNIANLKSQVGDYTQAMLQKGYDPIQVNAAQAKVYKDFDKQVALKTAKINPGKAIENLESGAYSHLGPVEESRIRTKAEAQFGGQIRDLQSERQEITKRILNDQALPGNVEETMAKVGAMSQTHPELVKPFQELAALQHYSEAMRTKTVQDQKEEQIQLAVQAATNPEMSVQLFENMQTVLANNIRSMEEDGLGYAAKHGLVDLPPLPKDPLSAEGRAALDARKLAAATATQITGIQALPFTKGDIEQQIRVLEDLAPIEKMQHLAAIASIDPSLSPAIAEALTKKGGKDPMATAFQIFAKDPVTAQHILIGSDLLKTGGQVKPSGVDDRAAAAAGVRELFPGDPATQDQLIHAADAYRASIGDTALNEDHVAKVTGIIQAGGWFSTYATIPPRLDMRAVEFNSLVENMTQQDLTRFGNDAPVYSPGQPFDITQDSLSNYQMKPTDIYSGEYYLIKDGKSLKTSDGSLYRINLGKMTE